jgi:hypothetical protein
MNVYALYRSNSSAKKQRRFTTCIEKGYAMANHVGSRRVSNL